MQEYANLLYAWATAGRANPLVFETVIQQMISQHGDEITTDSRPQEWSNSIYAAATSQIYQGHEDLLHFVAHLLETYPDFCDEFSMCLLCSQCDLGCFLALLHSLDL